MQRIELASGVLVVFDDTRETQSAWGERVSHGAEPRMDLLIELLFFFLRHWRLGLLTLGAIVAALVLSTHIEWFTSPFCIGLGLAGFVAGVLWQGAAEEAQFLNPRVAGHRPRRAKRQLPPDPRER